jgi:uncharacterized membrane protein
MQKVSLYTMSLMYIAAGINHFWHKAMYLPIMPNWLGYHEALIILSGIFEIVLGSLILPLATRRLAAWGIILLLVAVFPANVQMLYNFIATNNPYLWLTIVRLPLQILLIWWAYTFTKKN